MPFSWQGLNIFCLAKDLLFFFNVFLNLRFWLKRPSPVHSRVEVSHNLSGSE